METGRLAPTLGAAALATLLLVPQFDETQNQTKPEITQPDKVAMAFICGDTPLSCDGLTTRPIDFGYPGWDADGWD